MSNTNPSPNYDEIIKLSNTALTTRTKAALDAFMQAVTHGGNVAEKARLYNAYQDERLNRLNINDLKLTSKPVKRPRKDC